MPRVVDMRPKPRRRSSTPLGRLVTLTATLGIVTMVAVLDAAADDAEPEEHDATAIGPEPRGAAEAAVGQGHPSFASTLAAELRTRRGLLPYVEMVDTEAILARIETSAGEPDAVVDAAREAVWDRLAACESGGDWHINTGNGFYGGLQFTLRSWQWVGATGYPHEHPREVQIEMAERLLERQGWRAWPACSRQLGLR